MNNRIAFPSLLPERSTQGLFDSLNKEMARVFNEFDRGGFPRLAGSDAEGNFMTAKLDYSETDDAVEVSVEVPGFKEEDIDVELNGRVLSMSGKRETRSEEDKKDYHITERESGSFLRKINLDFDANPEKIDAHVDAGVLMVKVEKPEEKKVKKQKITVQAKK